RKMMRLAETSEVPQELLDRGHELLFALRPAGLDTSGEMYIIAVLAGWVAEWKQDNKPVTVEGLKKIRGETHDETNTITQAMTLQSKDKTAVPPTAVPKGEVAPPAEERETPHVVGPTNSPLDEKIGGTGKLADFTYREVAERDRPALERMVKAPRTAEGRKDLARKALEEILAPTEG
ncbi:MAG: hypothetical protein KAI97_09105, partial [Gemmatimonadetes bacterium]|nr:hypothetical protein [Gemmatimonadota bacterium]